MSNVVRRKLGSLGRQLKSAAVVTGVSFGLLWIVEVADLVIFGSGLDAYGVHPRSLVGLAGVLTMPFLHGGFLHLFSNTVAGVPLAFLSMERRRSDFFVVSAVTAVTAGMGAWLFGSTGSVHIGASGVVFGLLGFLMARGFYERRVVPILMSVFVGTVWGSMLIGLVPGLFSGISWQAHLFGFLGGVGVARFLGRKLRQKPRSRS